MPGVFTVCLNKDDDDVCQRNRQKSVKSECVA